MIMCDKAAFHELGAYTDEDLARVKRLGENFKRQLEKGESELARYVKELHAAREK